MDLTYKDLKIYSKRSLPPHKKGENTSSHSPRRRTTNWDRLPSTYPTSLHSRKRGEGISPVARLLRSPSKPTYGRSSKKPTVGRLTGLPWVARTTYRRSSEGVT